MKAKHLRTLLLLTIFSLPFISFAQDAAAPEAPKEEKAFTISGSVDTYTHTSLGYTNEYGGSAPTTSFSNLKGFGLGMLNLITSYNGEKAGFVADVVFGPRGYDAVFTNQYSNQRIVNQLYAYVKLGKKVTLNMGQFNTFVGYEVISPTLNFNYSCSYLFSYGPFNHTGIRADFDLGGGFIAKLAVMNPTDYVEFNPVKSVTLGGQLGYTNDKGGLWLNFLYGDQDGKLKDAGDVEGSLGTQFQADLTTGWTISDAFYLGVNGTYRTYGKSEIFDPINPTNIIKGESGQGFMGAAIYPKLTLSDAFALGLRAEYFAVKKGGGFSASPFNYDEKGDGSVIDVTLSGNIKAGNLTFIPEVRIDKTSENSFYDKDGKAKDMIPSLTLAAVYKF